MQDDNKRLDNESLKKNQEQEGKQQIQGEDKEEEGCLLSDEDEWVFDFLNQEDYDDYEKSDHSLLENRDSDPEILPDYIPF